MTTRTINGGARTAPMETTRRIETSAPSSTLPIYTGHLLRKHLRPALFWTIALGIYTALIMLSFPSFRDTGALSTENYPEALLEAFNIQDMTEVGNYLESQVTSYAPLVVAFFPIMAFAGAIAGAEERSALDIMLGTPLPRRHLVLANWISVAALLFGMLMITGMVAWGSAQLVDVDFGFGRAMKGFLNIFPITLAFGSFALALSAKLRSRGAVIGISFAVVFLMYLIDILGKIVDEMENLRWLSLFRFYGSALMDGLDWGNIAILVGVSLLLLAAALALFERRDIYT